MIALDAHTDNQVVADTSLTYSHTCSGSNRILFVGITVLGGNTSVIDSVTYAGASMTRVDERSGDGPEYVSIWMKVGPASGANNVVISLSTSRTIASGATSFTGASQSGQPDNQNSNYSASTSSLTTSVTTTADNCWIVGFVRHTNDGNPGSGTNTTVRDTAHSFSMFDTNAAQTPAGSHSINTTASAAEAYHVIASFSPSAVTTTTSTSTSTSSSSSTSSTSSSSSSSSTSTSTSTSSSSSSSTSTSTSASTTPPGPGLNMEKAYWGEPMPVQFYADVEEI